MDLLEIVEQLEQDLLEEREEQIPEAAAEPEDLLINQVEMVVLELLF